MGMVSGGSEGGALPVDPISRPFAILIVDDHPVCTLALTAVLRSMSSAAIIHTAAHIVAMHECLHAHVYSHIFVDLKLGDVEDVEALMLARATQPRAGTAVFSGLAPDRFERKAARLGACAFIPKTLPLPALEEAVGAVLSNRRWFSDTTLGHIDSVDSGATSTLSAAELRVMHLVCRGLSNKLIAHELQLAEATIKTHLQSVFRKLEVFNRTQAVLAFRMAIEGD